MKLVILTNSLPTTGDFFDFGHHDNLFPDEMFAESSFHFSSHSSRSGNKLCKYLLGRFAILVHAVLFGLLVCITYRKLGMSITGRCKSSTMDWTMDWMD